MPARPNSNATLIRDGYARAIRTFPYSRQREFLQLEAHARTAALDARDQKMIAIEARLRQGTDAPICQDTRFKRPG